MNAFTDTTDTAVHQFPVTIFPDLKATTMEERSLSIDSLVDLQRTTRADSKSGLPLLKLATFGDRRTPTGCLRHDDNLMTVFGVEADYDGETVDPEEAVDLLTQAGVRAIVYTSPSHTPTKPRWRVLAPFSGPLAPALRDQMLNRLNGILGGVFTAESWARSQSYYFGTVIGNEDYQDWIVPGDCIDTLDRLDAGAIGKPGSKPAGDKPEANGSSDPYDRRLIGESELRRILAAMPNRLSDFPDPSKRPAWFGRNVWVELAHAIGGCTAKAAWARTAFLEWSSEYDGDLTEPERVWDSLGNTKAGLSTLMDMYESWHGAGSFALGGARPPAFSDDALALRFAELHAGEMRHVAAWGQWLHFDGSFWAADKTLKAFDFARRIGREAAQVAAARKKPGTATAVTSSKTVAAQVSLARSDRRLAMTENQWDGDPLLLNTPGGTVDLRTGMLRPHDRLDYITKITAVAPAPSGTPHPIWTAFLNRIMGENSTLIAFCQRFFGYALTGCTDEHAFVFAHGGGANGKGTLIKAITTILHDYATAAAMETFIETRTEQHPTDVAGLVGARLVTAQETQKGRKWDETKIKTLTGGDMIKARRMRQDFFDFTPTFKLLIAGNHRPRLNSVDEAIRRRFILLPFTVTIPKAERDRDLGHKLEAEYSAILRWAIDGCLQWQAQGLNVPAAIRDATESYLADQDTLGEWLDEKVQTDAGQFAFTLTTDLFHSWKAWCEERNISPGTQQQLSEALQGREIEKVREGGSGRRGFRVSLAVKSQ